MPNVENNLTKAMTYLGMAHVKIDNLDYDSTLAALSTAHSNIREAMDIVLEMKAESDHAARHAKEDTPCQ